MVSVLAFDYVVRTTVKVAVRLPVLIKVLQCPYTGSIG